MQITRRNALLGASAALAAGLPAPMLAAGEPVVNTALQQLCAEWAITYQAFDRALDELALVESKFRAVAKERGIEFGTKAYEALGRECGLDAAEAEETRTLDEVWEGYERILNTPAGSLQDMALKIKVAQKNDDSEVETPLVQALAADLEHLEARQLV